MSTGDDLSKEHSQSRRTKGRVWWDTPVIPVLKRLRQQDCEFEFSLHYIATSRPAARPCLKKKKKN
jgi:hypothetical protein